MKDTKGTKLYNVIFPVWMVILLPQLWIAVFAGNFIIDSLVLIVLMSAFKMSERKQWYKKHILKVFSFGFISDFIGALYMLVILYLGAFLEFEVEVDAPLLTVPAMVLSAALIFVFNYFVSFKKADRKIRLKSSIVLAVCTAPYTFLIPVSWLY